jgi:uncharacterized damage-inducible protein DinB
MADALATFKDGLKTIFAEHHADMRRLVQDLDADALNWQPGKDTNSLAVLVTHLLGAEHHCITTAFGEPIERDRDAEFRAVARGPEELLALIDQVDAVLPGLIDRLTAEDLATEWGRPGDRLGRVKPGIWWVLHGMRQGREHIGQMMLTRQLYEQQVLGQETGPFH